MGDEDCMTIGSRAFCFSEIHSLIIGDTSLCAGNPDPDCCLTIVTAKGTVALETASKQRRDFWANAIKTRSIAFVKRNEHEKVIKAQRRKSNQTSIERQSDSESSTKPSKPSMQEKTKNHKRIIHQHSRQRGDARNRT